MIPAAPLARQPVLNWDAQHQVRQEVQKMVEEALPPVHQQQVFPTLAAQVPTHSTSW